MARLIEDNPLFWIEAQLTWKLEHAQKNLADFQARLAKDALYAFEWSHDAFTAAAQEWAAKDTLAGLKATKADGSEMYSNTVEGALAFLKEASRVLMEVALHEARWPSHSTSVQSNEAAREKASAACKLAEDMNNWARSLKHDRFVEAAKARLLGEKGPVFLHYGVKYHAFRKSPNSKYYVATADDKQICDHMPSLESAIDFARTRAAQHEYEVAKQNGRID